MNKMMMLLIEHAGGQYWSGPYPAYQCDAIAEDYREMGCDVIDSKEVTE